VDPRHPGPGQTEHGGRHHRTPVNLSTERAYVSAPPQSFVRGLIGVVEAASLPYLDREQLWTAVQTAALTIAHAQR
jgi:hypothetical protein